MCGLRIFQVFDYFIVIQMFAPYSFGQYLSIFNQHSFVLYINTFILSIFQVDNMFLSYMNS